MSTVNAYSGAFESPVLDAQSSFRIIMDCMARPGLVGTLSALTDAPRPLSIAQAAIALTLCDHDTPVHLSQSLVKAGLSRWFAFQTGAPITPERHAARFAFVDGGEAFPALSAFAAGSQDYPDRSATLVIELPGLEGGTLHHLTGPGIRAQEHFSPKNLPKGFLFAWAENRKLFPRGVDLILTAGNRLLCLPRSVTIHEGERG